jgi:membrane protein implicated in regulation of membrane protease activity
MRGSLAAAGMAVAGALSCLAIPLTAAIIGLSDLAAFGTNLGFVAIVASALIVAWTVRTRSRGEASASGDRDG